MTAQPDPYVRVRYAQLEEMAELDDAALGLWLRLRMGADAAYPSAASLPRRCDDTALAALEEAGLVESRPGDRYRMPALDEERESRTEGARRAGLARAATAQRGPTGRYATDQRTTSGPPAGAGQPSSGPPAPDQRATSGGPASPLHSSPLHSEPGPRAREESPGVPPGLSPDVLPVLQWVSANVGYVDPLDGVGRILGEKVAALGSEEVLRRLGIIHAEGGLDRGDVAGYAFRVTDRFRPRTNGRSDDTMTPEEVRAFAVEAAERRRRREQEQETGGPER